MSKVTDTMRNLILDLGQYCIDLKLGFRGCTNGNGHKSYNVDLVSLHKVQLEKLLEPIGWTLIYREAGISNKGNKTSPSYWIGQCEDKSHQSSEDFLQ